MTFLIYTGLFLERIICFNRLKLKQRHESGTACLAVGDTPLIAHMSHTVMDHWVTRSDT
jgi:hypothetical protein